jgi:hypothetical protein
MSYRLMTLTGQCATAYALSQTTQTHESATKLNTLMSSAKVHFPCLATGGDKSPEFIALDGRIKALEAMAAVKEDMAATTELGSCAAT